MNLKFFCYLLLITLICKKSYSQEIVKIGLLEETIYPFELNSPNLFFDFFKSKSNSNEIKIIGMGEATHGTKEFFNIKKETFKFLALHYNYRIFGIEASFGGCSYINDYVSSGTGNIDSVILNFDFWTWRTEEVKDLILWIKDFNLDKSQNEKIIFYGFDMQNIYSPIQYLNTFFNHTKIENSKKLHEIIKPITQLSELDVYKKLENKILHFSDTLFQIHDLINDWLQNNKAEIQSIHSERQFRLLQFCSDNYYQAIKNLSAGYYYRDSCMAVNITKIQQQEDAKMFIWAHNGHINLSNLDKISGSKPMGAYLKSNYREKYYSIGFVFSKGNFQAVKGPNSIFGGLLKYIFARKKLYKGLIECSVPNSKRNTLTNNFKLIEHTAFLIDLINTNNTVFTTSKQAYDIGAVFINYKRSVGQIIAKEQFNSLIYLRNTTRATPLKRKK